MCAETLQLFPWMPWPAHTPYKREPDISPQLTSRPLGHLAPLDASPLPIRHLTPHILDTSPQSIIIMIWQLILIYIHSYCVTCSTGYYFVYTYFWVSLRYYNWVIILYAYFRGKFARYFNWYIILSDTHLGKFQCREPGIPPLVFNRTAQAMTGGVS